MLTAEIERKAFAGRVAIAGLRFGLAAGEILAICGPSGCGKSTLLRLVAGLDADFDGALRWTGATPRLGMAFQEPRLLPWRTVRDNLALANAVPRNAAEMLDLLGLADAADVLAGRLSLGMARRVALARALAVEPDLLLLDEPFASLDAAAVGAARGLLLRAWTARPCAVLLVTHDLADAAALADRVLLLSPGPARVVADVTVPPSIRRAGGAAAAELAAQLADYFSVER